MTELLLCDGQVRLLEQHLFDILNGCEGGDPEWPRPDVVVINGQPSQPEKNQGGKYWREKKTVKTESFWKKGIILFLLLGLDWSELIYVVYGFYIVFNELIVNIINIFKNRQKQQSFFASTNAGINSSSRSSPPAATQSLQGKKEGEGGDISALLSPLLITASIDHSSDEVVTREQTPLQLHLWPLVPLRHQLGCSSLRSLSHEALQQSLISTGQQSGAS